jgi:hypothetical protein
LQQLGAGSPENNRPPSNTPAIGLPTFVHAHGNVSASAELLATGRTARSGDGERWQWTSNSGIGSG